MRCKGAALSAHHASKQLHSDLWKFGMSFIMEPTRKYSWLWEESHGYLSAGFGSKFHMYKYFQLSDVLGEKATKNVYLSPKKPKYFKKNHTRSIR